MKPDISIIVPIYNVEKYLNRCVDSILKQSFVNFELILVNDGSTDSCAQICDNYSKMDKRVRVIHKENGGAADSRNAGLDIAKGEYIGFVDSDDWIENNMYEILFKKAKKFKADVVICRALRIENGKTFPLREYNWGNIKIFNSIEALKELFLGGIDCSNCTKIYKKSLYKSIRFPIGKINEDFVVLYKIFNKSEKIIYIKDILYNYEMRKDSITTSTFSIKNFDCYYNAKEAYEYAMNNLPDIKSQAEYYYYYITFCIFKQLLFQNIYKEYKNEYYELLNTLRLNILNIIKNRHINNKFKCSFIYISVFPKLYSRMH